MAQRPASRGMGMGPPPPTGGMRMPVAAMGVGGVQPKSMFGAAGAAPIGMRPPTNAGRPGSSAGVPQGMRPPTAGGAAAAGAAYAPLQTDVNVVVRPVTGMASGVSGMPTKPMGPGRVIADKGYYVTDLNKKTNDISGELENMRFEMNRIDADTALYAQLERKYDSHMTEVRTLEGQLADFNLAFDKLRTNTNVAEIRDMYTHLRERNEREKKQVDDIFLKASHQEKQTREIEERIAGLHAAAAARIASLGPDAQSEYLELQEELVGLNEQIQSREGVLGELEDRVAGFEDTMKSEGYRLMQAGLALQKELSSLSKQKQDLEDELHSALSPAEVKEKLTLKIKDATATLSEMEREAKRLEGSIEKLGDATRARETELADLRNHASKARKYDAIFERAQAVEEFITGFPQAKNGEIEKKRQAKEVVVALLKHIAKEINAAQAMEGAGGGGGEGGGADGPNKEKFTELKDEVSFKDKKLADSEKTLVALQADLAKRREELEKIDSLDAKISREVAQLQGKITEMQTEMKGFVSEEVMKEQSVQAKKDLMVENAKQKRAREAIRVQVGLLSAEMEKRSRDLAASEPAKRVEAWETKLKTHAGAVFTLQEYMSVKKRESDYEGLVKECSDITRQINDILVQQR